MGCGTSAPKESVDEPKKILVGQAPPPAELLVLHFNDVYNIGAGSKEPVGGGARFTHMVNSYRKGGSRYDGRDPLVLFSGDAFNPSLTSTVYKGKQMVPVLNAIKPEISVYGNHDFDFGLDNLHKLAGDNNFPWLMSNVKYLPTGRQLADGIEYKIVEWEGRKIGVMGLVEWEWMATLATISEDEVEYEDFVKAADRLAAIMREQGATFIIALTHMRVPNDERLARECPAVDLICGGHDHHYDCKPVGDHQTYVLKSGTDFRDLTECRVKFGRSESLRGFSVSTEHVEITKDVPEDEEVKKVVEEYEGKMGQKMEQVLGQCDIDLDARFTSIRTSETNVGNLICDIMKDGCNADIAILNSGTLRADTIIPAGPLRLREFVSLLPMVDELCVLEMNKQQLIAALENGVSQYPRLEGRFPQVSGVSFQFDATLPAGGRVLPDSVTVGGNPVTDEKYSVVIKAYLALGKDGYTMFPDCKMLVDSEAAPVLPSLVRNYFTHFGVLNGFRCAESTPAKSTVEKEAERISSRPSTAKVPRVDNAPRNGEAEDREYDYMVSPKVEGRIVCVGGAIETTVEEIA